MVFEWDTAEIDTGGIDNSSFTEEYDIGNSLGKYLGKEVKFNKVLGYVYISGLKEDGQQIDMSVSIAGVKDTRKLKNAKPNITFSEKTDGTKIVYGELTTSSFAGNTNHLDLTPIFDNTDEQLKVNITIPSWTIYSNDVGYDAIIKCDLFALLPMDLKVSTEVSYNAYQSKYVMLEFGKSFNMGDDDLFRRKEGEDNYLRDIQYVAIGLEFPNDIKNDINIIDYKKLYLLATTGSEVGVVHDLKKLDNDAIFEFTGASLGYPFNPKFTLLLEKEKDNTGEYEDFGSFKILRADNPSFNFKLNVSAKATLEYILNLGDM
jgi:hypothetical protein